MPLPTQTPVFQYSLHNIAVSVSDLDSSVAWWARIFGLQVAARSRFETINADVAFMKGAGFQLELLQVPGCFRIDELFADPPEHVLPIGAKSLVFQVDDLATVSQRLQDEGVTILWREQDLGDGSVSTAIRDNDGNVVNIFQRGSAPTP
jgi:catechol 2,3-dioxygenase-like lactoylglutathione lyase family enzyme